MQAFALDLVLIREMRDKNQAAAEAFKLAVISADPQRYIPITYPEWVTKRDDEITEEDFKESEGEWRFEQAEVTQEEIEQTLAMLMQNNTITLNGEDLVGEDSPDEDPDFLTEPSDISEIDCPE